MPYQYLMIAFYGHWLSHFILLTDYILLQIYILLRYYCIVDITEICIYMYDDISIRC